MKKLIISLVCLLIISSSSLLSAPWSGSGTSASPYIISNQSELEALMNSSNTFYWSSTFTLTQNIDCGSTTFTEYIGQGSTTFFSGYFNGQNYTISNFKILPTSDAVSDYVGLFGYCDNATIINLKINNFTVETSSGDIIYLGGIAGVVINSLINNCQITNGLVRNNYLLDTRYVGGITAGEMSSTITNCYVSDLTVGGVFAGGCVSMSFGLDDYISDTKVINTTVMGIFSGGIVAYINNSNLNIQRTYLYMGHISGTQVAGGIIAYSNTFDLQSISQCYSTGTVSADEDYAGGFIGYMAVAFNISNCYTQCIVSGSCSYTGGFAGYLAGFPGYCNITNCYASGAITGTSYKGGFCAENKDNYVTFSCCYWNADESGVPYGIYTDDGSNNLYTPSGLNGLNDAQMRNISIFYSCGWNTASIWLFTNDEYPQLRALYSPTIPIFAHWTRIISVLSVLLMGCYFVYRKLYA